MGAIWLQWVVDCAPYSRWWLRRWSFITGNPGLHLTLREQGPSAPQFWGFPSSGEMLDLWSIGRGFESQLLAVECNPEHVVNTRASVTKQYNLVPANGQWCLAAEKITVGLASHWPHVTDITGTSPTGSMPRRGRWAPAYALFWSMVDFTILLFMRDPLLQNYQIWPGNTCRNGCVSWHQPCLPFQESRVPVLPIFGVLLYLCLYP